jgi:hypothetical protein
MNYLPLISGSLTISALLHFVTAPERFAHASLAVGLLYIFLGIFQLILAVGFYRTHKTSWAHTIYLSSFVLFLLFILNQDLAGQLALFVKEPYSIPTVLRKTFEIVAGVSAILFTRQRKIIV